MLDENRCTRKPKLLLVAKSLTSSIAANAPLALGYDHSDVSTRPPLSSWLVGPEGPQNQFPRKVVMYMRPTKKKLGRSPKNWGREPQFKIST